MSEEEQVNTAPELTLRLIMLMPDENVRVKWVKDFCRLYDISERKHDISSVGRIFQKKDI